MNRAKKILTSKLFYEIIFICGVLLAFIVWLADIFKSGYSSTQFNLFFGRCKDFFADMTNCVGYSSQKDVYNNTMYTDTYEKIYPALPYILTYCFSRLVDMNKYHEANFFLNMYQEPFFLIVFILCLFIILLMIFECIRANKTGENIVKVGCAMACVLSMPVIFTIERANLILITVFCLLFFVFYYDSDSRVMRELALLSLALAFAFKMTPAVFGMLLLYDKKVKEATRAAIYALLVGIVPFLFFKGGLDNIRLLFRNMSDSLAVYTDAGGTPLYACFLNLGMEASDSKRFVIRLITYLVCLLIILTGFYSPRWEAVMGLGIVLLILPGRSASYCVLYLIPAFIVFLNQEEHRISDVIVLFASLLILYHVQWPGRRWFDYHMAIILLTLFLVVRACMVWWHVFQRKVYNKNK